MEKMYHIKQIPEDFGVKEISNFQPLAGGAYCYFKLEKKNWNTLDAVKSIGDKLNIPPKEHRFCRKQG